MNILLITLDQFRGDCLSAAGHPVVRTPNLDRLAREGARLARHYSQAAPCGPGRASLYTGMYQMNHRVVANGTPLDRRFDNIAKAARRAGYEPTLFGYTDQAVDPRDTTGQRDPRLLTYEEILPGFEVGLRLGEGDAAPWTAWLRSLGHAISSDTRAVLASEPERPAEHSLSAFLTDAFLVWLERRQGPWFAHLSQLRPHPPYAAAGHFATMYDPAGMPVPIAPADDRHRLHKGLLRNPGMAAPSSEAGMRRLQAQYYGMVSEADHQLGRVWTALEARGDWDDTFIVLTADHGEQLGDHGLIQKGGFFEQSYHILGHVRDPRTGMARGAVVEAFTENVDVFPTLCEAMGIDVPAQCDGAPLTPFLRGEAPPWWRDAAHWEFDWRGGMIRHGPHPWPWDRRLERRNLAVRRGEDAAYVHFGDGSWLCFDLTADATWRTPVTDPAAVLKEAQALLTWRARHADRTLTGMLVEQGGIGRWPEMPAHWEGRPMPTPEALHDVALRDVAWDDPDLSIRGALHLKPTASGILPRRLPAWTLAQMPDPALDMMASMPSGVRLVMRTDARRMELDVMERGLRFEGAPRRPATFDLFVDGALARRLHAVAGQTVVIDGTRRPPAFTIEPGEPSTLVFDGLPAGPKILEIWLPQSATVELRGLRVDGDLAPLDPSAQRRWAHYGSSISHGMEADGPSETWPAVAARAAGVELTSLGLGGQCHLDGMVARTLRDADVDLISLKLGINLLNGDTMRERVFNAAVHSFLDTIRDAKPRTPILVVSPILCPAVEHHPGPTLNDGTRIYTPDRPEALALGALTARRIRALLAGIVERRREAGDAHLHYLNGLALFAEPDLADLPDGLHPNAAGLRRMGERFAAMAFGPGGAFAEPERDQGDRHAAA